MSVIRNIPALDLISAWQQVFQVDASRSLSDLETIQLYRCDDTGLMFFWPACSGDESFYRDLSRFPWYYKPSKWEHDIALAEVRGRRLLEIGAGTGAFLLRAKEVNAQAEGTELNREAFDTAKARGCTMLPYSLEELESDTAYDVVAAFQVLEHVPQPRAFLDSLVRLTRPGGRILLGVPNGDSYLKYGDNLLDHPPHHLTRWSPETFAALGRLLPVRLHRVVIQPLSSDHVEWFLKAQLCRISGWPRRLARRTLRIADPLLRHTGFLRRRISGHTLYVSLLRT